MSRNIVSLRRSTIAVMAAALFWPAIGAAQEDESESFFGDIWKNVTINTTLRADAAYRTTQYQNPNNQTNAPFQDVLVPRQAYVPPTLSTGSVANIINSLTPGQLIPATPLDWNTPFPGIAPYNESIRRSDRVGQEDLEMNYTVVRATTEIDLRFNNEWRVNARIRGLYDPTVYDEFDAGDVSNDQGGITCGGGDRYADTGKVNYYKAKGRNGRNINPLEIAGRDYMVDFGTLILNYKADNYDIRIGNQQIAWGQAIFFRTFDVANGLDLRRHLVIDRAVEEFEDERVPKLAIRATAQVTDATIVDGYVGKFQPDILTNPNTPYNVIPSQFYRPLDNYFTGNYDKKIDVGMRVKSDYGNWGWQAMAVSRYNPLGAFRWAESGINKGLYGAGGGVSGPTDLSTQVETAYNIRPTCSNAPSNGGDGRTYGAGESPTTCKMYGSIGESLSHTPFTIGPGGIYSDREWFSAAASVRLDGFEALNTVIREYPALQDSFASEVSTLEQASHLLNTFFIGSGGSIRGNVQRDYFREQVFGLGLSSVTETEDINSFWSQFIINLEVQYTPKRMFTKEDLSNDFLESDEYIITLVGEKWYRYTESFPAAYLVFQGMHRSDSDLVGLNLRGYGGTLKQDQPKHNDGLDSANYLVFAGFQPWPNRKFIAEWAFLLDVKGGLLAQPLIKWNPGNNFSVDLFYNFIDGKLWGDGESTLQRAIDFADEVGIRFSYQL